MIEVSTCSYYELYHKYPNLEIPDYQRAYTWDKSKIDELIQDWKEYLDENPAHTYYMGTILLYKNEENNSYQIIDGQQRLTSLSLIYKQLYNCLLEGQNMKYNQNASAYHIVQNLGYIRQMATQLESMKNIFDNLEFTLILSDSQDNSFSFFDSQNNRGVSLGIDDYLKAYHLRALPEKMQSLKAKLWEAITFNARKEDNHLIDLKHLFNEILFKLREWKGQYSFSYPNKDNVLKEFQKNTYYTENENSFRLFHNNSNIRYQQLQVIENGIQLISTDKPIEKINYPFAVRQPIYKGQNFFDFTEKYNAILAHLFSNRFHNRSEEVEKTLDFYYKIYTNDMSEYLRYYMQMCLVAYFDNFKEEQLYKVIQYLDYYLGAIRLEKYYVRQEAVKNSLINASNNLLDVICNAYLPQEIFNFINQSNKTKKTYTEKNYLNGDKKVKNHIVDRYIIRVCNYYQKNKETRLTDISNRKQWII